MGMQVAQDGGVELYKIDEIGWSGVLRDHALQLVCMGVEMTELDFELWLDLELWLVVKLWIIVEMLSSNQIIPYLSNRHEPIQVQRSVPLARGHE